MVSRRAIFPLAAGIGMAAAGLSIPPAEAATGPQDTVDHALGTLQHLRGDKEFGNARQLFPRASAVLIAPRIFKAGFFIGGEGGRAVMLTRSGAGWNGPAFYTVASASFGLQFGAQESELIMFVMSTKALHALMRNKVQFGANAGIAVATIGTSVAGATTSNGGPDIIVWASSAGIYVGVSLNGTLVQPDTEADRSYYGEPLTSAEILLQGKGHNAAAAPLTAAVTAL